MQRTNDHTGFNKVFLAKFQSWRKLRFLLFIPLYVFSLFWSGPANHIFVGDFDSGECGKACALHRSLWCQLAHHSAQVRFAQTWAGGRLYVLFNKQTPALPIYQRELLVRDGTLSSQAGETLALLCDAGAGVGNFSPGCPVCVHQHWFTFRLSQ